MVYARVVSVAVHFLEVALARAYDERAIVTLLISGDQLVEKRNFCSAVARV